MLSDCLKIVSDVTKRGVQHRLSYLFVGVSKQVALCGVGRNLSFRVMKKEVGTMCDLQLAAYVDKFNFATY